MISLLKQSIKSSFSFFPPPGDSPVGIYEKSEMNLRIKEGLKDESGVIYGTIPNEVIIEENGLKISVDIINKHKNTLSRPHLADEIALKTGLPIREIFEKYIGDDCPGYIPSTLFKTEDGIDLIHKTGGYAILAHPYLYKKNQFLDLMNLSFDGVEVFYSPSPVKKYKKVLKYALKHNLLITGGSDFHRDIDQEKHEFIGTSIISDEYILKFIEFMEK